MLTNAVMVMQVARNWVKYLGMIVPFLIWRSSIPAQLPPSKLEKQAENVVLTTENRVEARKSDADQWMPAAVGKVLRAKGPLRTGYQSRAALRLANQTILRLNQLSTLVIQPSRTEEKRCLLDLQKGAAYIYHRDIAVETEFRTPLDSAAIRGNELHLAVAKDGRTVMALIDGEVKLSNAFGQTKLVSGEMDLVEPGGPPQRTAMLEVINLIQWALYYPAVLDLGDLELSPNETQILTNSLAAYRAGDILRAVSEYPTNRVIASVSERLYSAALLLAALDRGLELSPSNAQGLALRGFLLAARYRLVEAESVFNRAIGQSPSLGNAWLGRGLYRIRRGDINGGLSTCRLPPLSNLKEVFSAVT